MTVIRKLGNGYYAVQTSGPVDLDELSWIKTVFDETPPAQSHSVQLRQRDKNAKRSSGHRSGKSVLAYKIA